MSMVVDLEAIILPRFDIIMQVGFVILDPVDNTIVKTGFYSINQPYDRKTMTTHYGCNLGIVDNAIRGYIKITGDKNYQHMPNVSGNISWTICKEILLDYKNEYSVQRVWAKGNQLESRAFKNKLGKILELADYDCPKYPSTPHNPMKECIYFSAWVPDEHQIMEHRCSKLSPTARPFVYRGSIPYSAVRIAP